MFLQPVDHGLKKGLVKATAQRKGKAAVTSAVEIFKENSKPDKVVLENSINLT